MDKDNNNEQLGESTLEEQAEKLFPFPIRVCSFVKKKILWKRELWVREQLLAKQSTSQ